VSHAHQHSPVRKLRESVDPQGTNLQGLAGLFEWGFRRFKMLTKVLTLIPIYLGACICLGTAAAPALAFFFYVLEKTQSFGSVRFFLDGSALAVSFFIFGFCLLGILPLANFLLRTKLHPWRGPYYSFFLLKWFVHNGLTYLMRYTFLPYITPSPFNAIFYRLMGMKIGKGSILNTEFISDPSMISIGNKVTIGGSVTIIGHYGVSGYFVCSPVEIGNEVTIGLKASIFPGVVIGDLAKILPHSVVLPNTKIPAGETWGGIPAKKIS
jgi:hypothetical protein